MQRTKKRKKENRSGVNKDIPVFFLKRRCSNLLKDVAPDGRRLHVGGQRWQAF